MKKKYRKYPRVRIFQSQGYWYAVRIDNPLVDQLPSFVLASGGRKRFGRIAATHDADTLVKRIRQGFVDVEARRFLIAKGATRVIKGRH